MCDDISPPLTPDGPSDDPSAEPSANRGSTSSRSDCDEPGRTEPDRDDDRPRDGVDPPEEAERDRSERDRSETDGDCDEERDPESMEYRLERLRLLRTVVTLAVVVARLIRSL